ncbi:hypothetical protein [Oscillibacter sp. 1-3]|nr:hypothetical protein [Oscillibacter sp. 1-3]
MYDKLQFIGQLYHKNWKGHDGGFLNRPVLKMGGFDTPYFARGNGGSV